MQSADFKKLLEQRDINFQKILDAPRSRLIAAVKRYNLLPSPHIKSNLVLRDALRTYVNKLTRATFQRQTQLPTPVKQVLAPPTIQRPSIKEEEIRDIISRAHFSDDDLTELVTGRRIPKIVKEAEQSSIPPPNPTYHEEVDDQSLIKHPYYVPDEWMLARSDANSMHYMIQEQIKRLQNNGISIKPDTVSYLSDKSNLHDDNAVTYKHLQYLERLQRKLPNLYGIKPTNFLVRKTWIRMLRNSKGYYVSGNFTPDQYRKIEQLPYKYPYYTQFTANAIWATNEDKERNKSHEGIIRDRTMIKIVNDDDRTRYITALKERIWSDYYLDTTILKDFKFNVIFPTGRQKLIPVAKMQADNCLLAIIRNAGINTEKVYKTFPHLRPTEDKEEYIYVTHEEVERIAKMLRFTINTYSALGARLNRPWHQFKIQRGKTIHVRFADGHASIVPSKISVTTVAYQPTLTIPTNDISVVDYDYFPPPRNSTPDDALIPKYFTRMQDNNFTLHKVFRPSSVTNNPEDDLNHDYNYVFTPEQMLYRLFKKHYSLTPIQDPSIRSIVKSAEHFINRKRFSSIPKNALYTDKNKCFTSYKTLPQYMGFPTENLVAMPVSTVLPPFFVIASDVTDYPQSFKHLYSYSSGPITLTMPVYNYLISVGATVTINYYLCCPLAIDIDIVAFGNDYINKGYVKPADIKLFRNTIIGRTIGGGMKETKKMTVKVSSQSEFDQLVYECDEEGLTFDNPSPNTLVINFKNNGTGLFHFHSYILGYASIHMMEQWHDLEYNNCIIHAYNVDSLIYSSPSGYDASLGTDTMIGGWKLEVFNACKRRFYKDIALVDYGITYPQHTVKLLPISHTRCTYNRPIVIHGAGGLGKSHGFKVSPLYDQIMLTPTLSLRDAHKSGNVAFLNTHTVHKYIQFSCNQQKFNALRKANRIPKWHLYIVIDELTMFSKEQWDVILERTKGSIIIALGDFEQICMSVNGTPVTLNYFKKRGFDIEEFKRTSTQVARHNYQEGVILDSLRGCKPHEQAEIMSKHLQVVKETAAGYDISRMVNNIFITDTHRECNRVNMQAKAYYIQNALLFPCRDQKNRHHMLFPNDPLIWWGRTKMSQVIPQKYKYEPAFAMTPDSVQGQTITTKKVYVDTNMSRHGAFYTSVTRTPKLQDTILCEPKTDDEGHKLVTKPVDIELNPDYLPLLQELKYTYDDERAQQKQKVRELEAKRVIENQKIEQEIEAVLADQEHTRTITNWLQLLRQEDSIIDQPKMVKTQEVSKTSAPVTINAPMYTPGDVWSTKLWRAIILPEPKNGNYKTDPADLDTSVYTYAEETKAARDQAFIASINTIKQKHQQLTEDPAYIQVAKARAEHERKERAWMDAYCASLKKETQLY